MSNIPSDFLLKNLNEAQKEAVSAPLSNILVVAGAGTGKTRVLVSRIAYLVEVESLHPREILAVTFTNKAAKEMQDRIASLIGFDKAHLLWASTFHAVCLRLLRAYSRQAGLLPGFGVLDMDSQEAMLKSIMKEISYVGELKASEIASRISKYKEKRIRAKDLAFAASKIQEDTDFAKIYDIYERQCQSQNLVDFSELLLRTVELLEQNEAICDIQHRRFKEILVDEFQDTNSLQFTFLKLITGKNSHIMVVGDDDQSIYGWRGADYTNMSNFKKDFAPVNVILLKENYRSTQNILDMANTLIEGGKERLLKKVLDGNCGAGDKVKILKCSSEYVEADFVAKTIKALHAKGQSYDDIAVLYRTNQQSLLLEQRLSLMAIPFVIYGGQKFFERAEIQDALAYMRLLVNERDDQALRRIINVPPRRIGEKVVSQLSEIAYERGSSLFDAVKLIIGYADDPSVPKEIKALARKLMVFSELMDKLKLCKQSLNLPDLVHAVIELTGLIEYYKLKDQKASKGENDNQKHKNLEQLVSNATLFNDEHIAQDLAESSEEVDPLLNFISTVTLSSSADLNEEGQEGGLVRLPQVNLMTIHSSKGLEFSTVFLVGFEKNLLPSYRAESSSRIGDSRAYEEERRLAYVGITRAREQLFISYALKRMLYGRSDISGASNFLREIVNKYQSHKIENRPYKIEIPNTI